MTRAIFLVHFKRFLARCAWVIGGLLAFLVVAIVTIAALLQTDWGRNQVRLQLEDLASNQLRGELSIGALEGNVLGGFSLRDVQLRDRAGQLVLSTSKIAVDYRLAPVLAGELRISSLEIEEPELYLEERDGDWNLIEVLPPRDDKKSTLQMSIDSLALHKGRIVIDSESRHDELRNVEMDAALWIDGETIRGAVYHSSIQSARWPNAIELAAKVETTPLVTRVEQASLRSGKSALVLEELVLRKGETAAERAPHMRASLHGEIQAEDLRRLSQRPDWRADLEIAAGVSQEDAAAPIAVTATLGAAGAALDVQAELRPAIESAKLDLEMSDLDPQALATTFPKGHLDATVSVNMRGWSQWRTSGKASLDARVDGALQGRPIEKLALNATLDDGVATAELMAKAPGADVQGSAQIALQPETPKVVRSQLRADLNLDRLARLVPIEGRASGRLTLEAQASGPIDALQTSGSGEGRALRYLDMRARRLSLGWQVALGGELPEGTLDLSLRSVRVGQEQAQRLSLEVASSDARSLEADVAVSGFHKSAARVRARVHRRDQGLEVQVPRIWLNTRDLVWRGRIDSVYLASAGPVSLRGLQLRSKAGRVEASARWPSRPLGVPRSAQLRASDVDLGALTRRLADLVEGDVAATGTASLSLDIAPSRPLHLQARVRDLSKPGKIGSVDGRFELTLDQARAGTWTFAADAGIGGKLSGQGSLRLRRNWRHPKAWQTLGAASFHEVDIKAEELSISGLGYQLDEDLSGKVDGTFSARDGFREAHLDLHSAKLQVPTWTANPVDARIKLLYEKGHLRTDSRLAMRGAGTVEARLDVELGNVPLYELGENFQVERVTHAELRGDKLNLEVLAQPFPEWRDVRGKISGKLLLNPSADTAQMSLRATDLAMGRFAAGVWRLHLDVDSDAKGAEVKLRASPDSQPFLLADLRLPVTLRGLIAGDESWRRKALTGRVKIPSVALRRVKIFREKVNEGSAKPMFGGQLSADFKLRGSLLKPKVDGQASGRDLHYGGVPLPELTAQAHASEEEASFELKLAQPKGLGWLAASVRADWNQDRIDAQLRADSFNLAFLNPLLLEARIPVASLSGTLEGQGKLRVRGPTRELSGAFKLNEGRISLPQPLESLHELSGDIKLSSDKITATLEGESRRGSLTAEAELALVDLLPDKLRASVETKDLPLSVQGADVVASLNATLAADLVKEHWALEAKLDGGEIYLPRIPTTQALHPIGELEDVVFVSELKKRSPERHVDTRGWDLRVKTDKSVRVHGDDLDVDLEVDLHVTKIRELVAEGTVRAPRGEVTILDRKYRVEEARVELIKDEPRPMLYVRVSREFPQAAVIISVSGYPDDLDLDLTAQPAIYSHEEILSLIVNGVPSAGSGNRDQAVLSAVAGLATQQITSRLRDPLGVDTLAVGTAEGGGVSSVQVGKWLTDAIFIAYYRSFVADPTKNQDEARMEWWLSGDWLFEVRAGDAGAGSADLLWIFRY